MLLLFSTTWWKKQTNNKTHHSCHFIFYILPIIQEVALPGLGAADRLSNFLHSKNLHHLIPYLHLLQSQFLLTTHKKNTASNGEIYQPFEQRMGFWMHLSATSHDSQTKKAWCQGFCSRWWISCFLEPSSWERTDASAAGVTLLLPDLSGQTRDTKHFPSLHPTRMEANWRIYVTKSIYLHPL